MTATDAQRSAALDLWADGPCSLAPDAWLKPATVIDARRAAGQCYAVCPRATFELCATAAAELLPSAGIWAGQQWTDGRVSLRLRGMS